MRTVHVRVSDSQCLCVQVHSEEEDAEEEAIDLRVVERMLRVFLAARLGDGAVGGGRVSVTEVQERSRDEVVRAWGWQFRYAWRDTQRHHLLARPLRPLAVLGKTLLLWVQRDRHAQEEERDKEMQPA